MATLPNPALLSQTFRKEVFNKDFSGWLGRATPADRERFERVFQSIEAISESKAARDGSFADRSFSMRRSSSAAVTRGRLPESSAGATASPGPGSGWSYTATRAALGPRPETRIGIREPQRSLVQDSPQPSDPDRPQSAPGGKNHDSVSFAQAAARRRAISFAETPGRDDASAPSSSGAAIVTPPDRGVAAVPTAALASSPFAFRPSGRAARARLPVQYMAPDATTYQEGYNVASAYPDAYDKAVQATRAEQAPNQMWSSTWGNSLKVGADETAKLYMRTTYNTLNDEVVRLRTDFDAVKEREFFKWVQKQKTYFGDLLSKSKAADFESLFAAASDEQKRELLDALRTMHATTDPDKVRSHSQAVHCYVAPLEDAELRAQLKAHTRARTMGNPHIKARKGSPRRQQQPTAVVELGTEPEAGGGLQGRGRPATPTRRSPSPFVTLSPSAPQRAYVTSGTSKDTFKSHVPLQWATGQTGGPQLSTYIDTYGGAKIGAGRVRPNSALFAVRAVRPPDVSCPYGALNPHTAMQPERLAYPVGPPGRTLSAHAAMVTTISPHPDASPYGQPDGRVDQYTRDAEAFAARLRNEAALVESSKRELQRSTIPMGPTGPNLVPPASWVSEARDAYVPHEIDVAANRQSSAALKAMFMGPTASAGKVATLVEKRVR